MPPTSIEFNKKLYYISGFLAWLFAVIGVIGAFAAKAYWALIFAAIWLAISFMAIRAGRRSPE